MRNAFGALLVDPASLTFRERVDCLRRLQGRLAAASDLESQWMARALRDVLDGAGDDVLALLGLRSPRGSHRTVAGVVAQGQRDAALLQGRGTASRSTVARARRRRSSR